MKRAGCREFPFECIRSLTTAAATYPGKGAVDAYFGATARAADRYVKYTKSRFANDPYARQQHKRMFGQSDENWKRLDKDKDGSWIVGPIVRYRAEKRILRGFISADRHLPEIGPDGTIEMREEKPRASKSPGASLDLFQTLAVDVVTDLLAYLRPYSQAVEKRPRRGNAVQRSKGWYLGSHDKAVHIHGLSHVDGPFRAESYTEWTWRCL